MEKTTFSFSKLDFNINVTHTELMNISEASYQISSFRIILNELQPNKLMIYFEVEKRWGRGGDEENSC